MLTSFDIRNFPTKCFDWLALHKDLIIDTNARILQKVPDGYLISVKRLALNRTVAEFYSDSHNIFRKSSEIFSNISYINTQSACKPNSPFAEASAQLNEWLFTANSITKAFFMDLIPSTNIDAVTCDHLHTNIKAVTDIHFLLKTRFLKSNTRLAEKFLNCFVDTKETLNLENFLYETQSTLYSPITTPALSRLTRRLGTKVYEDHYTDLFETCGDLKLTNTSGLVVARTDDQVDFFCISVMLRLGGASELDFDNAPLRREDKGLTPDAFYCDTMMWWSDGPERETDYDIFWRENPNYKLYYPEPYIASPSFIHEDIWFIHILHFQYWLWFLFITIIMFYFITFINVVRWCNVRTKPKRETRGLSRSKCADLITASVPLMWAIAILVTESFDTADYNDGFGNHEVIIGIRAFQWGWEYYYPKGDYMYTGGKTIPFSQMIGNSLRYDAMSSITNSSSKFWKYYQSTKKTSASTVSAAGLISPHSGDSNLNFFSLKSLGGSTKDSIFAYKRGQRYSRTQPQYIHSNFEEFSNRYTKINSLFTSNATILDNFMQINEHTSGRSTIKSSLNNSKTLVESKALNKYMKYSSGFNYDNSLKMTHQPNLMPSKSESSVDFANKPINHSDLIRAQLLSTRIAKVSQLFTPRKASSLSNPATRDNRGGFESLRTSTVTAGALPLPVNPDETILSYKSRADYSRNTISSLFNNHRKIPYTTVIGPQETSCYGVNRLFIAMGHNDQSFTTDSDYTTSAFNTKRMNLHRLIRLAQRPSTNVRRLGSESLTVESLDYSNPRYAVSNKPGLESDYSRLSSMRISEMPTSGWSKMANNLVALDSSSEATTLYTRAINKSIIKSTLPFKSFYQLSNSDYQLPRTYLQYFQKYAYRPLNTHTLSSSFRTLINFNNPSTSDAIQKSASYFEKDNSYVKGYRPTGDLRYLPNVFSLLSKLKPLTTVSYLRAQPFLLIHYKKHPVVLNFERVLYNKKLNTVLLDINLNSTTGLFLLRAAKTVLTTNQSVFSKRIILPTNIYTSSILDKPEFKLLNPKLLLTKTLRFYLNSFNITLGALYSFSVPKPTTVLDSLLADFQDESRIEFWSDSIKFPLPKPKSKLADSARKIDRYENWLIDQFGPNYHKLATYSWDEVERITKEDESFNIFFHNRKVFLRIPAPSKRLGLPQIPTLRSGLPVSFTRYITELDGSILRFSGWLTSPAMSRAVQPVSTLYVSSVWGSSLPITHKSFSFPIITYTGTHPRSVGFGACNYKRTTTFLSNTGSGLGDTVNWIDIVATYDKWFERWEVGAQNLLASANLGDLFSRSPTTLKPITVLDSLLVGLRNKSHIKFWSNSFKFPLPSKLHPDVVKWLEKEAVANAFLKEYLPFSYDETLRTEWEAYELYQERMWRHPIFRHNPKLQKVVPSARKKLGLLQIPTVINKLPVSFMRHIIELPDNVSHLYCWLPSPTIPQTTQTVSALSAGSVLELRLPRAYKSFPSPITTCTETDLHNAEFGTCNYNQMTTFLSNTDSVLIKPLSNFNFSSSNFWKKTRPLTYQRVLRDTVNRIDIVATYDKWFERREVGAQNLLASANLGDSFNRALKYPQNNLLVPSVVLTENGKKSLLSSTALRPAGTKSYISQSPLNLPSTAKSNNYFDSFKSSLGSRKALFVRGLVDGFEGYKPLTEGNFFTRSVFNLPSELLSLNKSYLNDKFLVREVVESEFTHRYKAYESLKNSINSPRALSINTVGLFNTPSTPLSHLTLAHWFKIPDRSLEGIPSRQIETTSINESSKLNKLTLPYVNVLAHNTTNTTPIISKSVLKSALTTWTAVRNTIKVNLDMNQSRGSLHDISNSAANYPGLFGKARNFNSTVGKNRLGFLNVNVYKTSLMPNISPYFSIWNSQNSRILELPFAMGPLTDIVKNTWFDKYETFSKVIVSPSALMRHSLMGFKYPSKAFEYESNTDSLFKDTEKYFIKRAHARKNHLPGWSISHFIYNRISNWHNPHTYGSETALSSETNGSDRSELLYTKDKRTNDLLLRLLGGKYLEHDKLISWYSGTGATYWEKYLNSHVLFNLTRSDTSTLQYSNVHSGRHLFWDPLTTQANYYYVRSLFSDIMFKRENAYRSYLLKSGKSSQLPNNLTSKPNNEIYKLIRSSLPFYTKVWTEHSSDYRLLQFVDNPKITKLWNQNQLTTKYLDQKLDASTAWTVPKVELKDLTASISFSTKFRENVKAVFDDSVNVGNYVVWELVGKTAMAKTCAVYPKDLFPLLPEFMQKETSLPSRYDSRNRAVYNIYNYYSAWTKKALHKHIGQSIRDYNSEIPLKPFRNMFADPSYEVYNTPTINRFRVFNREFFYSNPELLRVLLIKDFMININKRLVTTPINVNFITNQVFMKLFGETSASYHHSVESQHKKSQFRPMRKGIINMVKLHGTNAVAMPTEIRLRIMASSKDVIHSWAIPSAGIKIDCIPGYSSHRITIFLVSGIFWGQCMEICGRFHHWMPIIVYFMRRDLFFLWCSHFVHYSKVDQIFKMNDKQASDRAKVINHSTSSWANEIARII